MNGIWFIDPNRNGHGVIVILNSNRAFCMGFSSEDSELGFEELSSPGTFNLYDIIWKRRKNVIRSHNMKKWNWDWRGMKRVYRTGRKSRNRWLEYCWNITSCISSRDWRILTSVRMYMYLCVVSLETYLVSLFWKKGISEMPLKFYLTKISTIRKILEEKRFNKNVVIIEMK